MTTKATKATSARLARALPLALLACVLGLGACSDKRGYPTRDLVAGMNPDASGSVQISGTTDHCPAVRFTVAPPDATVGQLIDVNAVASDPDVSDKLTTAWTATAGSFADANAVVTTYSCDQAGPQTVTVSVSDGLCTVMQSASIFCYGSMTGAGGAGVGGRGGAPGGSGGAAGSGAGTGGAVGAGGRAGTGGVSGTGGMAATCTGDPTMDEGAACTTCTVDNCVPFTINGCEGLDNAKTLECWNLYCCIRANRCAVLGDPLGCWCGTTSNDSCWTGAVPANGPCLQQVIDAAGTKDPGTIHLRFVDPAYAVGRAVNLALCRGSFCGVASGYTPDDSTSACRL